MSSCRNCFDNCAGSPISDKCIKYTGDAVPLLDICKGDQLSLVQSIVLDKLLTALDGTGITPEGLTLDNAPNLLELLGFSDPTLVNILQILIDNQQTLTESIEDIVGSEPFVFDIKCLSILSDTPTRDEILQAAINLLCSTKATVDLIPTTYVKQSDLTTLVNSIITGNTGGGATVTQNYLKMVAGVAYEYYGSLSNFDSQGKGISTQGWDKIYLCNGLNGTPDKRGRVAVGAVKNVPGATLGSDVDPMNPSNPNTNYGVGDKFGKSSHTLVVGEIPSHSHLVNDPGHTHNISTHSNDTGVSNQPNGVYNGTDNDAVPITLTTNTAFTNISIQSTGSGLPHNNVQPSIAALFIIYLP